MPVCALLMCSIPNDRLPGDFPIELLVCGEDQTVKVGAHRRSFTDFQNDDAILEDAIADAIALRNQDLRVQSEIDKLLGTL